MPDQGPEPSPWELMRGIQRIEGLMKDLNGNVVSIELFNAHLVTEERRIAETENDVKEIRAEMAARSEREQTRDDQARNSKVTNGIAIALGLLSVLSSVLLPIIRGGS